MTYNFSAVNQLPFSIFEAGDTISGQYTYDDALLEQDSPTASISFTYTDISTRRIAKGFIDTSVNSDPDLIHFIASNGVDESYNFNNLITESNTVFDIGIYFDNIHVRFANGVPTFVTMEILLGGPNGDAFGPNFTLISVSDVPLPAALPLFIMGISGVAAVGRKRRKAG